jgi:Fe-S-cluster-containing dehydrogenase component/formate-dependent nitrite reductase membrane component NrfD
MNYGFLIDNSACIGCHACSTACKSENSVPVGVSRTWVKYTEHGTYPDVRRNFQVTRCNHCTNPPCMRICPVGAMYQRDDGIVEFDSDACIGCKGCIQACPYDAIHLDPETHTAAKCHFCSHRIDVGLEPACAVVCPEEAIIAGDLDDPESFISKRLANAKVTVRKPEQGTGPKVFYIDGEDVAQHPTAASQASSFMWADNAAGTVHHQAPTPAVRTQQSTFTDERGVTRRTPAAQGLPPAGPIASGGRMATHMVQVAYDAQHEIYWHWQIPAYVVTKHIAGGTFALLGLGALVGGFGFGTAGMLGAGAIALVATAVTLGLLLVDLDRPDRFFYLLVRPQWRSWIARAAWILSAFSAVAGLWWVLELGQWLGWLTVGWLRAPLAIASVPLGVLTAIYTAFLFAQCEGRDLWQGPHLPVQMTAQAVALGAGTLALFSADAELAWLFQLGLATSLVVTLTADIGTAQPSEVARQAVHDMTRGRFRNAYWRGGILAGHVAPLLLVGLFGSSAMLPALLAASVGLYCYEVAFVTAAQHVPNS